MNPDKTNAVGTNQAPADEIPLSYAQFTRMLAQYRRAVYESIHQSEDPIAMLLKFKS